MFFQQFFFDFIIYHIYIMDNKNKPKRTKCIYCGKTIKRFSKSKDHPNRKAHRKCWLKEREFEWRCYDSLITGKENKDTLKLAYRSIAPTKSPLPHSQPLPGISPTDFVPVNQKIPEDKCPHSPTSSAHSKCPDLSDDDNPTS